MLPLFLLASALVFAVGEEVDQHIVNGEIATPHDYPWQLSLQRNGGHICGAVLISNRFAITAAHCVSQSYLTQYRIQCGAHNIQVPESTRQGVSLERITIHPQYNPNGQRPAFPNDIAVLKLASNVILTNECQVANLASGSNTFGGQAGMITGWGRLSGNCHRVGKTLSRLKEGAITVLTTSSCSSIWGSTVSSSFHVCILDQSSSPSYGACNVGNTVVGLASFVASGCLINYPSVYVRVSNYYSWIWNTVNSM
ncbi:hypothetical protein BaRGS_00022401 [Batillaria attramentaria]|uniref:Peptidase S1 domain-containing protein n=1 Tax=Batillaria attramentaria TaxID=370345 RepID=A0ABD0KGH8_9CAEN